MTLRRIAARFGRPLLGIAVFVGLLALVEAWARSEGSFRVPPVTDVLERSWGMWRDPDFFTEVSGSLERLAAGFVIGSAIGIALGLAMGSSHAVRRTLDPAVELLRATPPIAIVPTLIVVLGFGADMRIAVIAVGVCFPVLVNTVQGVRAVSPEVRDTASMLHVGGAERVFLIYLPSALPYIAAGLRIAISIGLVMVVISEFVGEGGGLGSYILDRQGQFDFTGVYASVLLLGLLGYVLNRLFLLLERRLLAWHYGAAGEPVR